MSENKKKILFVFHNSGLTGASLVLLRYVQFLSRSKSYDLYLLLPGKGKIELPLSALGKVQFYNAPAEVDSIFIRGFRKLGVELKKRKTNAERIEDSIVSIRPDLVYFNTIACAPYIAAIINKVRVPIAWHIHELKLGVQLTGVHPKEILNQVQWVIANSETTANFIDKEYGVSKDKMTIHHPVLPAVAEHTKFKHPGKFIVGSSGTALVHKGALLFIDLASAVNRLEPENDFEFRWIGNAKFLREEIDRKIVEGKLQGKVIFTGELDAPMKEYSQFDFFVSLSHEESFGLACMEVASLEIPIGGFAGSGGIEELLCQCDGLIVPYLDVEAMAKSLVELRHDPLKRHEMARKAKVLSNRFSEEIAIPEWIEVLESRLNRKYARQ